jgi:hypothetical protein
MYFDWITWSIWSLGFIIMVLWIAVPLKEFRKLVREHKRQSENTGKESGS